jgi:preprotein translocase subunit YajC
MSKVKVAFLIILILVAVVLFAVVRQQSQDNRKSVGDSLEYIQIY